MTLDEIERETAKLGLGLVGSFHPVPEDLAPSGIQTLCLFGPTGPDMWKAFSASPEFSDGLAHPMDRWSERVIQSLGDRFDAQPLFPFGGPPWQPFQRWATKAEGAVSSPVGMQATPGRGLWTSYRGALGFKSRLTLAARNMASPCASCHAPCLSACPVDAFATGLYDVPKCVGHVKSAHGIGCSDGCKVRKSCPYGAELDLPAAQRKFHIDAFLRANG